MERRVRGPSMTDDLLEVGRRLADEDPLCDACFGRIFADRSHGLANAERGKAVRITIALTDDSPFEDVDGQCWVCESQSSRYDSWASKVVDAVSHIEFETYQIGTRVPPLIEENDRLLREVAELPLDAGESFKSDMNREVGKRVGIASEATVSFERPDILVLLEIERGTVEVQINPAFVYGRYRKLERYVSQTEWPCSACSGEGTILGNTGSEPCSECDGIGKRFAFSVEGVTVPPVVSAMNGTEGVFHGAGREDVDALMLGRGRPFVVEVKHPRRRRPDLKNVKTAINEAGDGHVEVDGLRLATHEMVERVKELDAKKEYRMKVEFEDAIDEERLQNALATLTGTTIEQRTPNRVSHRRADLDRLRTVYTIDGELVDEHHAQITVLGEGGLYIKELISGDDGRTEPSVAGLVGVPATVTALDVLDVCGEEEVFENDAFFID